MNTLWRTISLALIFTPLMAFASVDDKRNEAAALLAENNYEQAYDSYLSLANEHNDPLSILTIALFHQYGWNRPINEKTACHWFEKAANFKLPAAQDALAKCQEQGIDRDVDFKAAQKNYLLAADAGHHLSYCKLAQLYAQGKGVKKDLNQAISLCEKSAVQNSPMAMIMLADLYRQRNTINDDKSALNWYLNAANMGVIEAYFQIGVFARDGKGTEINTLAARDWFEKAAAEGYRDAYFQTAQLYFHAPKDPDTSLWFENDLAKAYLWLSATITRSQQATEVQTSAKMLEQIEQVMPTTWKPSLDKTLQEHLAKFNLQPTD